mmetsp:Transcript_3766/g.5139  ORF Transcript_3766/g.5139 Transcript_3766/m.5139 type:complete len:124 (+) Transcript_3766:1531-1902(+)
MNPGNVLHDNLSALDRKIETVKNSLSQVSSLVTVRNAQASPSQMTKSSPWAINSNWDASAGNVQSAGHNQVGVTSTSGANLGTGQTATGTSAAEVGDLKIEIKLLKERLSCLEDQTASQCVEM